MWNNGNQMSMPRMTPSRPIMTPPRTQYLPGRFINNENDITPGEIPMDGSISFFCTNDLGRIIIKQWNANGTLDTMSYVQDRPQPVPVDQQSTAQMPDAPPAPQQQVPDQMQELILTIANLTKNIETAFNNFGNNLQQSISALSEKIDSMEGGRG